MFYWLSQFTDLFSGLNIFRYITFRSGMAAVTTFLICVVFGPWFIRQLTKLKISEIAKRKDAPALDPYQESKEGTPTMGGLFIIGSILVSVLLWADLSNRYILLTSFVCLWLTALGFADDYIKLTRPRDRGLSKRTKLIWQIMIGCFVGAYVYFNPDTPAVIYFPFFKNLAVDLGYFYLPFVALVVVGTSNAVNLTDGLDGLAIGCVLTVGLTLAFLSYIVGHAQFAQYLLIPHVPGAGELTIFCAAIIGASLGFLWFNCHPASVFMGDVGSLPLGGTLGVIAVLIQKEFFLLIAGGIFVIEALSVILQVYSLRWTGRRMFKMSPIHHHFQLSGWKESKIIVRFWIISVILAMLALTMLKIR